MEELEIDGNVEITGNAIEGGTLAFSWGFNGPGGEIGIKWFIGTESENYKPIPCNTFNYNPVKKDIGKNIYVELTREKNTGKIKSNIVGPILPKEEELIINEKEIEIQELKSKLIKIDNDAGAGRALRKTAIDMGGMLSALRKIAIDFGDMAKTLGVQGFNPDENEALKIVISYDPAEHYDLQKITLLENEAETIRNKISELENQQN